MHFISSLKKAGLFAAALALTLTACKPASDKTGVSGDDGGSGYASDLSRIELVSNDVISLADAAGYLYNGAYMKGTTGICATVGTDTLSSPHQLTIRFGDKDVTCLDGRTRRGTIIIKYSGEYTDTADMHVITFDNYYVNGNQFSGSIKATRVDTTEVGGYWYYKLAINDSLNMSPDPLKSQYIVWSANLVRRWIVGQSTNDRSDDVFSVSGNGNITRANGHVYAINIAVPLQFALNCDFAEAGVANVTSYLGTRILSYGSGSCDPYAQLSIGVNTYQLTMVK